MQWLIQTRKSNSSMCHPCLYPNRSETIDVYEIQGKVLNLQSNNSEMEAIAGRDGQTSDRQRQTGNSKQTDRQTDRQTV